LVEWDVEAKRRIARLVAAEYGVQMACQMVRLARSSYYYEGYERQDDAAFEAALLREAGKYPIAGYRHLRERLCRQERWKNTSRGRVQRWMQKLKIQRKRRRKTKRTTNSTHGFKRYPNLVKTLVIDHPNQVWVSDLTWIRLANGDDVYLAIIMDVFTRRIVGWALGRDLGADLTIAALLRASKHGTPEIHHSDQGVQYAAQDYTQHLIAAHVQISMAAVGKAWENPHAERVIGTIKLEEVALTEYRDFADALRQLGRFIDSVYNKKRIHSSLGYLTPIEFEAQWRSEQP
jgi:putative transposase